MWRESEYHAPPIGKPPSCGATGTNTGTSSSPRSSCTTESCTATVKRCDPPQRVSMRHSRQHIYNRSAVRVCVAAALLAAAERTAPAVKAVLCCAVLCCAVLCCATVVNTACTDARLGTGPARLPSALARLGYPRHWAGSATLGTGPARLPSALARLGYPPARTLWRTLRQPTVAAVLRMRVQPKPPKAVRLLTVGREYCKSATDLIHFDVERTSAGNDQPIQRKSLA